MNIFGWEEEKNRKLSKNHIFYKKTKKKGKNYRPLWVEEKR